MNSQTLGGCTRIRAIPRASHDPPEDPLREGHGADGQRPGNVALAHLRGLAGPPLAAARTLARREPGPCHDVAALGEGPARRPEGRERPGGDRADAGDRRHAPSPIVAAGPRAKRRPGFPVRAPRAAIRATSLRPRAKTASGARLPPFGDGGRAADSPMPVGAATWPLTGAPPGTPSPASPAASASSGGAWAEGVGSGGLAGFPGPPQPSAEPV